MYWNVNFYKTADGKNPIREFLDELPKKLRAKNLWEIGMLEEFGVSLPMPYAKQLSGKEADGL